MGTRVSIVIKVPVAKKEEGAVIRTAEDLGKGHSIEILDGKLIFYTDAWEVAEVFLLAAESAIGRQFSPFMGWAMLEESNDDSIHAMFFWRCNPDIQVKSIRGWAARSSTTNPSCRKR